MGDLVVILRTCREISRQRPGEEQPNLNVAIIDHHIFA
jgi:hypothetical protein